MGPKARYLELIASGRYEKNAHQLEIIEQLERIYQELRLRLKSKFYWKNLLTFNFFSRNKLVKGLYVYGGVGIGKTWLMDIFFNELPHDQALRMHFHRFMQKIHQELKQAQGQKNPLDYIVKRLAKKIKVLCFDEFFVLDIADAMILGNLLKALFSHGITLVTTSNVNPEDLYKNGISRENFLPAIDLIKQHTQVFQAHIQTDYRVMFAAEKGSYFWPLTEMTRFYMRERFSLLSCQQEVHEYQDLIIHGRAISVVRYCEGIAWFRFQDLCSSPRGPADYLELSKMFHTIFLSNVPQISAHDRNQIHYFIHLIDVFYDAKTRLVMSAETPIEQIYVNGKFKFQFERTKSRLHEMQTSEYWQQPHAALSV